MKTINTIILSALFALGSATVQADTSTGPMLLNNAQLDTVDAGRSYWRPRSWNSASASAGGSVSVPGVVYASGGADASASGNGRTAVAGATGGAAALGVGYYTGGRKGGSTLIGGAAMAGGSSSACSGRCY